MWRKHDRHVSPKRRIFVNLQVLVPGDMISEWVVPSPRNARKQRMSIGAKADDTSIEVLPYKTNMENVPTN